jgi:hypothetical protein
MVAVAREVERSEVDGRVLPPLTTDGVVIGADGTIRFERPTDRSAEGPDAAPEPEAGAAIGRLLFELLVGRPPLGRDDAFEPTLFAELGATLCALLARSFSDSPGQWPDASTWRSALEAHTRGLAPPPPPSVVRKERRRRVLIALGVALLALVTVVTLVLAPRWWDATEGGAPADRHPSAQERASS